MFRGAVCMTVLAVFAPLARIETERQLLDRATAKPPMEVWVNAARLQEYNAARRKAFLELEKDFPASRNRLLMLLLHGQLLTDMHLHKEAEAKFLQVVKEFKGAEQEPVAAFMAAQSVEYQGDYERARKAFRDYIKTYPKHVGTGSAARHIVYMLCDEGRYDDARAFGQQALKERPDSETNWSLRDHLSALPFLGRPLPELKGKTVDGRDFSTKETDGKVTLFFEWVPDEDDTKLLGQLIEVRRAFDPAKLAIVGIVPDEKCDEAAKFQEKYKLPWPSIRLSDVKDRVPESVIRYASFIVDREGKLRGVGMEDERLLLLSRRLIGDEKKDEPRAE